MNDALTKTQDLIERLQYSLPDDLRKEGWSVAVHNDYHQDGKLFTFWLFTRGRECVKGEGATDLEALDQVRMQVGGVCCHCRKRIPSYNTCCAACADERGP